MKEPSPVTATHQRIFEIIEKAFPLPEENPKKWQRSEWSGQHRYILKQRIKGVTLEEIGKKLGYTKERVRQKEAKALRIFERKIERGIPMYPRPTQQKSQFIASLKARGIKKI